MAPGASGKALVARISHANPGGTPGGTYRLPQTRIRGAAIVDAARMGSQPLALALAVAAGAVLSLALALLAAGNLLAAAPGAVAARTPPAALLRAE